MVVKETFDDANLLSLLTRIESALQTNDIRPPQRIIIASCGTTREAWKSEYWWVGPTPRGGR